jgi:pimeloyl-ACP methyl ester carboxylesterase
MSRVGLGDVALEVWEQGSGPPLLFLHGFPSTNRLWGAVVPRLAADGYRAIAPDLAGFGRSDAIHGLEIHMANQARWMFSLLNELDVDRAVVIAHDVGTAVAQIMAARAPERIRGLVLIDGVYADSWAMEAVESIQKWDLAAASRLCPVLLRRLRTATRGASADALREMMVPYEGDAGGRRLIRMARSLEPRQTVEILDELRRKPPPSLVLWGEKDDFLSVDAVGRPLAQLLGAELKLLPGGHFLPLDCPKELAKELGGFLSSERLASN